MALTRFNRESQSVFLRLLSFRVLGGGSEDGGSDTLWTAGVILAAGGRTGAAPQRNTEEERCQRVAI